MRRKEGMLEGTKRRKEGIKWVNEGKTGEDET